MYHLECVTQEKVQKYEQEKVLKYENDNIYKSDMKKAIISIRENNFQEEMLRRLNSIEEDKVNMEIRLKKFEETSNIKESYTLKEENIQTQWRFSKVTQEPLSLMGL